MKKTYLFFLLVFLMSISMETIAQNRPQNGKRGANGGKERPAIGQISGRIIDSITNETLEYTTVALYSKRNKQVVGGTISQANGRFYMEKIKVGRYDLKISFMGYEDKVISGIIINKEEHLINLHKIKLSPNVNSLQEVVIDGSAPRIEYQIDKKVINVGKQMTSISGTAVDVLENVPSVKVDIEGNVSLRGSGGFTVLIDGRPSVLDANDALQQIPASTIDNIEIITNPSAKYDPDGTAGIINIITKKNKLQGISGVANANVGLDNKYGGDFLINYKKRRANIYFGADYNLRTYPGNSYNKRWTQSGDTIFHTIMNGESERQREMWGFKAGIDYELSDNDAIGFSGRFGNRKMDGNTQSDYDEWKEPGEIHNIYTNTDIMNRGGQFYQFSGNYMHKFEKKGHEIKMEVSHSKRDFKDDSQNELKNQDGSLADGKQNKESGPGSRWIAKADYTLPLGEKSKLEAGFQTRFSKSEDHVELYQLNLENGLYELQEKYSNNTNYKRNIHSLYTTYAGELGEFGYQAGLRGEYTYRLIGSDKQEKDFGINRWDIFPTLHLSYNLPKEIQLMTSYTRRIQRSKGWYLEPFITWSDAFNVRQGNPELLPEYIDSFELGSMKKLGKGSMISLEAYYRITNNKVERVRSVYEENVMLTTYENVGKDYSLGLEMMFSLNLFKWWEVDLMADIYQYKVEGILYEQDFSNSSNNWSSRFNNTFKIGKSTKLQLNSMYNGESVTAQGKTAGYYMINFAARQDFFDRKLSATFQVRDIFSTAKHEFTSQGPDFYTYSEYERKSPIVTLSISYRFNNYRPDRKKNGKGGDEMEGF